MKTLPPLPRDRAALERELHAAGCTVRGASCTCPFPDHDDKRASGSIYTKADAWRFKCHGCGWSGDVYDLRATLTGKALGDVLSEARNASDTAPPPSKPAKPRKTYPTPEAAADACLRGLNRDGNGWGLTGRWDYRDAEGTLYAAVVRYDAEGDKTYRPLAAEGDGWRIGDPETWHPYRVDELPDDGPVWFVEGEKAADALWTVGIPATTTAHGAESPDKTDLSLLAGRDVILWPDNDDAGQGYAETVAGLLSDPRVRIIDPPDDLPAKGDAFDYIEERDAIEPDAIAEAVGELAAEARDWTADAAKWASKPFTPLDAEPSASLSPDLLPDPIRELVAAISAELEVPLELPLACALGVASTACQSRWSVNIKPGWSEPTSLFIAVPADPGERKTPVLRKLLGPLIEWEKSDRERCDEANKATASKRAIVSKQIKAAENDAAKTDNADALAERMDSLRADLPAVETPRRLFVDDTTPEQLTAVMRDAGGSIAAITDEGGAFLSRIAGHYSGAPNIDAVLKGWDNGPLRVDRANGRSVYLNHARLSLTLLMQAGVARDALTNPEFMQRGLVHRFLWMLPGNEHIGQRSGDGPPVPDALLRSWSRLIDGLLSWSPAEVSEHGTTTHAIQLTDAARERHRRYAQAIERAIRDMDEADPQRTYRQKWPGQTARLAGVLHCLEQAEHDKPAHAKPITEASMATAIALGDALLSHADKALSMLGQDLRLERARRIAKRLNAIGEPIKAGELWKKMKRVTSLFDAKEQFDDALDLLRARGYVAWRSEGKTEWLQLTPPAIKARYGGQWVQRVHVP